MKSKDILKKLHNIEIPSNMEEYETGTGQIVHVHPRADCEARGGHCCIHNPSDHNMVDWPTHWRGDRGLMERICKHGVGHPDPDDIAFKEAMAKKFGRDASHEGVHGCDGCCIVDRVSMVMENMHNEHMDDLLKIVKRSKTKQHKQMMRRGRRQFHKKGK